MKQALNILAGTVGLVALPVSAEMQVDGAPK